MIARRAWAVTAIVAGLHALFYLRQIVLTPALYAEFWLAKGGAHASTQIFLTDNLSPVWPVALLAAAALLAVWRGRSVFTPRRVAAAVLIAGVSAAVYSMPNRATATMKWNARTFC
ncbi:MAG: hypothetical protein M5R36_14640 [Deltaproteobacteria bacterium]|nr:hypothetical protein [Deltaproteobacteria bacterium]